MELFDLFFWFVGRLTHKIFRSMGIAKREMSDGGYVTLGFFLVCAVALILFIIWGVIHG